VSDLTRFEKLKKQVRKLQRETDRAEGALEVAMKELKKEFGCSTIEEAKERLQQLTLEERTLRRSFKKKLGEAEKQWRKFLT
jgi:hypothetical protein